MLNIAPSVPDCGQVWDVRVLRLSWAVIVTRVWGVWGVARDQSSKCPGERERADTRPGLSLSMIHETSSLGSVSCYICLYRSTPSDKSDPSNCPSYPQEASQGLPVIAPQHPLRMLSAGAIGQWNFLLLRIWKWGKLIWNEVCISTLLVGKLLSYLEHAPSIIFESTDNSENPVIFTRVIFVIMPKFWHILKISIIFSCKLTDLSWENVGQRQIRVFSIKLARSVINRIHQRTNSDSKLNILCYERISWFRDSFSWQGLGFKILGRLKMLNFLLLNDFWWNFTTSR